MTDVRSLVVHKAGGAVAGTCDCIIDAWLENNKIELNQSKHRRSLNIK
jgi:hypothetical protein